MLICLKLSREKATNKALKRDSQRVAFLLCVGFFGYGVMRKVSSSVGCPLTRRYVYLRVTTIDGLQLNILFTPQKVI